MSSLGAYKAFEPRTLGRVLKAEINRDFTIASVTLAGGSGTARAVELGEVLGQRTIGAISGEAAGGNTGQGGIGSITRAASAKVGDYALTCIATASNGGRFQVVDPDGVRLKDALVGVAYAGPQINFTIADGDPDFAVGDSFTVTVAAGDMKYVALAPSAVDGSQRAARISAMNREAPVDTDVPLNVIDFGALVNEAELIWPDGISAGDKAAAVTRLAERSILTRAQA
jgi:hypothetical protein